MNKPLEKHFYFTVMMFFLSLLLFSINTLVDQFFPAAILYFIECTAFAAIIIIKKRIACIQPKEAT